MPVGPLDVLKKFWECFADILGALWALLPCYIREIYILLCFCIVLHCITLQFQYCQIGLFSKTMHCIAFHDFALCVGIRLNATHCIATLEMWNQICQLASIDIEVRGGHRYPCSALNTMNVNTNWRRKNTYKHKYRTKLTN